MSGPQRPLSDARAARAGAGKVSVVIPAWKASAFVGGALASVRAQTHPVYEVLVVNDGCPPDETARLHAAVARFEPMARCLDAPHGGPGAARNVGIEAASGEYIALLDADDLWEPRFVEHQLALFAGRASLGLAYCDMVIFGGTPFDGRRVMEWSRSTGRVTFQSLATGRCVVLLSTVVARRAALISAGLFTHDFHCEDLDLWLRMALQGTEMAYTRAPLARRREHGGSASADSMNLLDGISRVLQPYLLDRRLSPDQRAAVAIGLGSTGALIGTETLKRQLRAGRLADAAETLDDLITLRPSLKLRAVRRALSIAPGLAEAALRAVMRARTPSVRASAEPVERMVRDSSLVETAVPRADAPESPSPTPPAPTRPQARTGPRHAP